MGQDALSILGPDLAFGVGGKKDVATKHIDAKNLTEQSIIAAIEELNSSYAVKKRNAEAISDKISTEHGVDEAVRLIESVLA